MPVCVLKKCCFCVDLKTGCYIIGYLTLVLITVKLVLLIVSLSTDENVVLRSVIFKIIMCALGIICSILLLIGLHKDKPLFVKEYLYFCYITTIGSIVVFIVMIATKMPLELIIGSLISILFSVYIIIVIRSYYYKATEESSPRTLTPRPSPPNVNATS